MGPHVSVLKAVSGEPREPLGDTAVSRVPHGPPLPSWSGDLAHSPSVQAWVPHRAPRDDWGVTLVLPCGAPCVCPLCGLYHRVGPTEQFQKEAACKDSLNPWQQLCPCPTQGEDLIPPPPTEASARLWLACPSLPFSPQVAPASKPPNPEEGAPCPPQSLSVIRKPQLWDPYPTASSSPFPEEKE